MSFSKSKLLSAAVLAGALLGSTSLLPAQVPAPVPDATFSPQPVSASTTYATASGPASWGGYGCIHGCDHGYGYGHGHGYIGKSGWVKPKFSLGRWLFCDGYCTHSPDHGWSPPLRRPVYRQSVGYQHYWPNHWYGTPNPNAGAAPAYPMVGTPTDTTQLGYYYQHVPAWRPMPGMIPPAPLPSQYHQRAGGWRHHVTPVGAWYPAEGTIETVVPSTPPPAPAPAEPVPPVPPASSPDELNHSAMLWNSGTPTS